jgi:asparagine synthase (glutamine-hydrolysing)
MCGIAGIVSRESDVRSKLAAAERIQRHRGPDGQGIVQYRIGSWGVGLGHQRLSIIDLSDGGRQPMVSKDDMRIIVYNGELYNYKEIRRELETAGYTFCSSSDTEVLLTALGHWGVDQAQQRFNGMWAYAYLDRQRCAVILSRDRVGVKPLYYCCTEDEIYFASEIKTLLVMAGRKFSLNTQVAGAFLLQSLSDISDETMFEGIYQIPAGHFGEIDLSGDLLKLAIKRYWQVPQDPISVSSMKDAVERVRVLFMDSVRLRLRSDVPVGVLLSGGVDSTSIACAMDSVVARDVDMNLLSATSDDSRFDESPFIDKVGIHLGRKIQKVSLNPDPRTMLDLLRTTSWFNDAPILGFETVLHYLLMQRAAELGITVVLSGQGADELLCGYRKYLGFYLQYLLRQQRYGKACNVLIDFYRQGTVLKQFDIGVAKRYLPSWLRLPEIDIRGERLKDYSPVFLGLPTGSSVPQRQVLDIERFSVPALTHYEDRMSMALSREIRLPFLDYRLIELLVPLPVEFKLRNGWTKGVFREALKPLMPLEITWRKDKKGFVNPESEWLKNELRNRVTTIFSGEAEIYRKGLVNKDRLLSKYDRYCSQPAQSGNISFRDIFGSLSLEVWLGEYREYIA